MAIEATADNTFFSLEDDTKSKVIDLLWKSIDGHIKIEQLLASLNEIKVKHGKHFESLVADVVSLIDVEIGSFFNTTTTTSTMVINSNASNDTNNETASQKKEKFYALVNALRPFIGDDLLKERLEIDTLESLKLIAKKEVFNQKYIKIKTRLFYKQQKFNLLREESEGYSKLITELGQTNLNKKVLENIQSLIGCFNLDPNRVLDIILESFENHAHAYETYIELLKHYKPDEDTICQIVGFKFQSMTVAATAASDSLYKMTSYLLKHGLVDLDALLVHLTPSDAQCVQTCKDDMEAARLYAKKLSSIQLASSNLPGSLDSFGDSGSGGSGSSSKNDSSGSNATAATTEPSQLVVLYQQYIASKPVENQRINLVRSLVEIEDYATALKLIDKMPQWYVAMNYEVTLAICRALDKNFIDAMYKRFNMLSNCLREKHLRNGMSSTNKSFRSQRSMAHPTADVEMMDTGDVQCAHSQVTTTTPSTQTSEVETEQMLERFCTQILPILTALGPGVSYDTASLFTKLIRICQAFLNEKKFFNLSAVNASVGGFASSESTQQSQKEQTPPPQSSSQLQHQQLPPSQVVKQMSRVELAFFNQIYTLLNEILLPSLSMLNMNPCLAIELWNLLKLFPYEMRYNLYHNWRLSTYKLFPSLMRSRAECQEKIKYLLKQIGKLSHNNPIIVCDYILAQIQRYDNFILPVVESLKFMTPLSYDILSYCIIVAISDAEKDKMKVDSTNLSTWLQSISTFCALAFKKYPIELIAMIQFVINQLKNKKSYDLLILQEIVQKMSGIEVLSEVNDLQLEAMAGGDLLRQEAGYFNPIRNIKKCANRLKEALADHGLILPLCILLSQQRDYIVFLDANERENANADKTHLKLIGCFYDQCQDSLVQFSQFLSSTLTTEEYISIFPKIDELVQTYHVSPDVAFFLSRPMYAHHIQSKYDELRRADRNTRSAEKPSKTQRYLEAIEYVMQPVIDLSRSLHPAKVWEDMSPLFYVTFWTLSMADCFVPSVAYDKQRQSLRQKIAAIDDQADLTSAKKKKEKEKLTLMIDKLTEEENKQRDHVGHVRARFEKEKDLWFPLRNKLKNDIITVFLQYCIFSRCLFTQIDAYYCAKFIQIIHSLKTPNFSTIICYDRIFSDISYSIASLTDNESRRYGRFLLGLLETVMSWHADPSVFEAECAQYPGFLTIFRNSTPSTGSAGSMPTSQSSQPTSSQASTTSTTTPTTTTPTTGHSSKVENKLEQLDYENFRHVCHKWHYKLTKAFMVCLESDEYLQMRNALIILTKIIPHYPKVTGFCVALEKKVEKLKATEKDKRQDIFTLASAYLGQLKIRKPQMVEESKFHLKEASSTTNLTTTDAEKQPKKQQQQSSSSSSTTNHSQSKQSTSSKQTTNDKSSKQSSNQTNGSADVQVIAAVASSSTTTSAQSTQQQSSSDKKESSTSKSSSKPTDSTLTTGSTSQSSSSSSSRRVLNQSNGGSSASTPSTPTNTNSSPLSSLKQQTANSTVAAASKDTTDQSSSSSKQNGSSSTTIAKETTGSSKTSTSKRTAASVPSSPRTTSTLAAAVANTTTNTAMNSNGSIISSPPAAGGGGAQNGDLPTPTNEQQRAVDDYSPTSSVSSDDLPAVTNATTGAAAANTTISPSRRSGENNSNTATSKSSSSRDSRDNHHHHHHHHHRHRSKSPQSTLRRSHSRSSSPAMSKSTTGSRSSTSGSNDKSSSSSKRAKIGADEAISSSQNGASSKMTSSSTNSSISSDVVAISSSQTSSSSSQPTSTTITPSSTSSQSSAVAISSSSQSSSSGKAPKLRRGGTSSTASTSNASDDRHHSSTTTSSTNERESGSSSSKDKKEHRKREHSIEVSVADLGPSQQKRTKSDDIKKSSSSSSSLKRDMLDDLNSSMNGDNRRGGSDDRRSSHDLKSSSSHKR